MSKQVLVATVLLASVSGGVTAQTLIEKDVLEGVPVLSRQVAETVLERQLFSNPYATVVYATTDVYERFPYVESRAMPIASDADWDRLVFGDPEQGLQAFTGVGSAIGALDTPRGLALDPKGKLYVSDSGNHRIVEFQIHHEFGEISLEPLRVLGDIKRPYDLAFSDGGTPDVPEDDRLYVAETGSNRVLRVNLGGASMKASYGVGSLGGGEGFFAGPTAIAVGQERGAATNEVFVADSHSRRLVKLLDTGSELKWIDAVGHDHPVITGIDTDSWGQVYMVGPRSSTISKYSRDLEGLDEISGFPSVLRDFHVVADRFTDHRSQEQNTNRPRGEGVLLGAWGDKSGLSKLTLGVDLKEPRVDFPVIEVRLTDPAEVMAEVYQENQLVARKKFGFVQSGLQQLAFEESDLDSGLPKGSYTMKLSARSSYEDSPSRSTTTSFSSDGFGDGSIAPIVLANAPNPFYSQTQIRFDGPVGGDPSGVIEVFDMQGRKVRTLVQGIAEGPGSVSWNATDEQGRRVASGIYLYRLKTRTQNITKKMVVTQ
ncbi:MAG: T9SS type A sorting domain-containing protein [Candidatus Eisenbacteria bacterium]|uniref:T9SS type A sorting domain-containing protein n=1 Tax=Eiseniibacteriota bacterium TaxID=2212470 RepID=A0A7Y2E777_UNCEI|nr:T9SS type A sorting domain-containing protein [Candidatus Eisenbacteria bacterium]